jgi:hypothetical protein
MKWFASIILSGVCTVSALTSVSADLASDWQGFELKQSPAKPFPGPFNAESVIYYVVHHGGDLKLTIGFDRWRDTPANMGGITIPQTLFFQVYDADENLVKSIYWTFPQDKSRRKDFVHSFTGAPAGIYQVRTTMSSQGRLRGYLATEPKTSFGVMASRCMLTAGGKNLTSAYVYAPPQAKKLQIYNRGTETTVSSLDGKPLLTVKSNKKGEMSVAPGQVYKMSFAKFGGVGFDGFPVILCPDEATARNIRGSVEVAADGTWLSHKFQVRMWNWMHGLKPSDLEVETVPLGPLKEKFLASPESASLLGPRGAFNHAYYLLKSQDLDSSSPEYGDRKNMSYLALFYSLDAPFNPYAGNRNVLNRYLLNQFKKLLKLRENGTFNPGWNNYSGGDALSTLSDYTAYSLCSQKLPEDLRQLWNNGIGRLINRFCLSRVSCENQSAHWLVDSYCMYKATGDETYKKIAADFAAHMADPALNRFIQTGYLQERYGPDATYQGLCASNLAFYCTMSQDENAKKTLAKIYSLFNHTVAPEPDGTVLGSSNFAHRTNGSWVHRQWTGGIPLMAGELADAGCWLKPEEETPQQQIAKFINWPHESYRDKWYADNSRWAVGYVLSPWLPMWHEYFYPRKPVQYGKFPVERETTFSRSFGDEFHCFRRQDYYALVYSGKTSHNWVRNSMKQNPVPKGWKLENRVLTPVTGAGKKNAWCPTQGLSMFWTPEYGNAILARNWNVYTAQTVRADLDGGQVSWSDYWSTKQSFDQPQNEVTISSELFKLPVQVTRKIAASAGSASVNLDVTFSEKAPIKNLVEQLPFLKKANQRIEFKVAGKWQAAPGQCTAVRMLNAKGQGILISFTAPVKVGFGICSNHFNLEIGLLEIALEGSRAKDSAISLKYQIAAVK